VENGEIWMLRGLYSMTMLKKATMNAANVIVHSAEVLLFILYTKRRIILQIKRQVTNIAKSVYLRIILRMGKKDKKIKKIKIETKNRIKKMKNKKYLS
jgi:hypothetical protein